MVEKRKQTTNGSTTPEVTADSPLPDRLAALEQRIGEALSSEQSASELSNLLAQLERAIPAAAEHARLPLAFPDPHEARQSAENASFLSNRLASLKPRLAVACAKQIEQETAAAYLEKFDQFVPERDTLEKEFATQYQELANKLLELFARVRDFQNRVRATLADPPAGVPVLQPISGASLLEKVTLLDLDTGKPLWPPPAVPLGVTLAQGIQFGFDPRFSSHWGDARLREQRIAEAERENEATAARFAAMAREQDERVNREAKEAWMATHGVK
jgi:hypothetical protein